MVVNITIRSHLDLKICYSLLAFVILAVPTQCLPPNAFLDSIEQVKYYGYPIEIYNVTTVDGYILQIHRIPHGLNNTASTNKSVALFMPGMLSPSGVFLIYGSEKSLPYILANLNYDIWIVNWRGSTYSRKHVTLDPDIQEAQFFNFSWHEIGIYDLPASIDYVLNATGQSDLFYIGHSMGTTVFFTMVTEAPEYYEKIRLSVLMGPIAFMKHIPHPLYRLAAHYKLFLQQTAIALGIYEVLAQSKLTSALIIPACADESPFQMLCSMVASSIAGWDLEQFNAIIKTTMLQGFCYPRG